MRFVVAPFIVAACLWAAPVAPAHAQVDSREGIALQNQIYQLRQELKSLEDQVGRGGGPRYPQPSYAPPPSGGGNDMVAQLLTRVDALEEQVRQLRGRIDETQNQLQRQNDDLGKRIDDLAFQINPQGGQPSGQPGAPPSRQPGGLPMGQLVAPGQAGGPPASPIPPQPLRPSAPPGPRPPELALQEGNAALARHDYAAAEAAAREVLSNRTSPRAYDAQFLLAQALAGERQYPQAAVAFDDAYNRSRSGAHAQDARLGLANALTAINEKKAACDVLARMPSDFPHLRPDISAGMAASAQRAACH
jgi:TolA-binding protein